MEQTEAGANHGLVPGHRVRVGKDRTRVGPGHEPETEPQIILVRDGDAIQAIEVVCTCGQRIRLKCVY